MLDFIKGIFNNKYVKFGVIGALLLVALYFIFRCTDPSPTIAQIMKERDKYKQQYDALVIERDKNKDLYNKKVASLSKQYKDLEAKYKLLKKEPQNVTPPKTSQERIDRLEKLGVTVTPYYK